MKKLKLKFFLPIISCLFLTGVSSVAQTSPVLTERDRVPVVDSTRMDSLILPTKVDANGNIYMRIDERPGVTKGGPVLKISRNGKNTSRFSLANVSGLSKAQIVDFCPNSDAGLVVLAKDENRIFYVVSLDGNGALVSKNKIDSSIVPLQFTVLPSGNLMVAGKASQAANYRSGGNARGPVDSIPMAVILSPQGQLLKNAELQGDIAAMDSGKRTAGNGTLKVDRDFEDSLAVSTLDASDDGNAYLMRYGKSGLIFVLSPKGQLLRQLKLDCPPGSYLAHVQVVRQRIAAEFIKNVDAAGSQVAAVIVRTYDAQTGKLLSDYQHSDSGIGSALAGYDGGNEFTFVATDESNRLNLVHVEPR